MIRKYQVTIYNPDGYYKPISCIVNNEQTDNSDWTLTKDKKKELQHKGVIKICQKKYWTQSDLKKYNYSKCKIRTVD